MDALAKYAEYIEQRIATIDFPSQPTNLYDPLRYFMQLGGKRIRPILTILGAELFDAQKENAIDTATAVEVFHNFTLIHDDIMDAAPLRRNQPTVHTKWDTNIAILSGDVLLVKAYQLLASSSTHLSKRIQLFNRTAIEVCEGQQMDMDFETRSDVTIVEYIEMIRLKTSVLLGCALELGALLSSASESDRQLLYQFGQDIGIAFQIQDDILDLYGDADKVGKQVGGDVIANKKTLLALYANELATLEQKEVIRQLSNLQDPLSKVNKTRELYNQMGVRDKCEDRMEAYYTSAMNALDMIAVEETKKTPLRALAQYILVREK